MSPVLAKPQFSQSQPPAPEKDPQDAPTPKARILLIEDESCLARIMDLELTEAGYDVTTVSNGASALHQLEQINPDLLLLDWGLPGMDGIEICRRLRQQGNAIPILFLTSRAEDEGKPVAMAAGATGYMMKPFSLDALLERMERILACCAERPEPPDTLAAH